MESVQTRRDPLPETPRAAGPTSMSSAPRPRGVQLAERAAESRSAAAIDRELVARFNRGDEAAFVEIVARHRAKILAIATQFLRNHADAEEIAQDTFIRAHRGLANFRGDSSLATWLHHITVNLARNRYWYFHRRCRHSTLSLDSPLGTDSHATFADVVASEEPGPERQAVVDEFDAMVTACMEKLDAGHREILTMRNLLHRSYDEIAQTLGINEGTVKSRIARARGRLREKIAAAYPDFGVIESEAGWFEPVRPAGCLV